MRIAILTQPLRTNYGGILQNYALQQCLKRMGHEPYTLDGPWEPAVSPVKLFKRAGKVLLGKVPASYLLYEKKYRRDYPLFTRNTRGFVSSHIDLYPYRDAGRDLRPDSFDAYVVGSDQVWRPGYNDLDLMFLDFAKDWDVRRVAYAASFGVEEWEFTPEQTRRYAALAKRFDAVSVREASGIALCAEHLGVPATQVLDPSMLLSREDYTALVDPEKTVPSPGNLFVHILDRTPAKEAIIRGLAEQYGATPFTCNQAEPEGRIDLPIEQRIQPPVEQWLRSFLDAEYVVTDSFHATVFAILMNKPLLVLGNPERGLTRIQSLLEGFGLEKCLFTKKNAAIFPKNDYIAFNLALASFRQAAQTYLNKHLPA